MQSCAFCCQIFKFYITLPPIFSYNSADVQMFAVGFEPCTAELQVLALPMSHPISFHLIFSPWVNPTEG